MKLGYYFLYILSFLLIIAVVQRMMVEPQHHLQPHNNLLQHQLLKSLHLVSLSLSAPENNEVCYEGEAVDASNSEVTFSWEASSDTDSYDLQITNQETNQTQTESGITATSKAVTLATDVSYSWKVVSKANDTSDTTELRCLAVLSSR